MLMAEKRLSPLRASERQNVRIRRSLEGDDKVEKHRTPTLRACADGVEPNPVGKW